jgi:ATP-dependent RNA helicase RhlE
MKDFELTSFTDLGLAEPIARALVDEKYTTPTPIQAQTIPQVLASRDVVGIAQTGTGKTAAFALPILNHLANNRRPLDKRTCRVLVLSPTRELSAQIADSFKTYGRYVRPRIALAIGGVPINRQIRALVSGVDVLVATPGRLLDLMDTDSVRLDRVEIFVLDEADRMLDMGFIQDIRTIADKVPSNRQSLFFSATMPHAITDLANKLLRDPVRVAVTPEATTVERIQQRVIMVDRASKAGLLAEVLRDEPIDRAIVFTRTKHGADKVVRALERAGHPAEAIHGNKSQNQRERVLASFRNGHIRTLIATDIAARGIDVDGITHVINYDLPNVAESYVHRIGRTARAGAEGIAISFCDGEERAFLRDIEKLIRISIPSTDRRRERIELPQAPEPLPGQAPVQVRSDESSDSERRGPRRPRPQHRRSDSADRQPRREGRPPQEARGRDGQPSDGAPRPDSHRQERHRRPDGERPARDHAPRERHANGRPGYDPLKQDGGEQPSQDRPHQSRENAGPRQGRPPQGRPPQGRPHQGRPHQDRPERSRGDHQPAGQDRNGGHNSRPQHERRDQAPARTGGDGDIAGVAFMQSKNRHRRNQGGSRPASR